LVQATVGVTLHALKNAGNAKSCSSRTGKTSGLPSEPQTSYAKLNDAYVAVANLSGTNLSNTQLSGADLSGANLVGSDLNNADFRKVRNLASEQVKKAKNWEKAAYDDVLRKELGLSAK
jgi:uncharacterized protein YjbI with pentapeptide repeats